MAAVSSAAIGFFVPVGSRDEAPEVAGAAHCLEHLLFKGTVGRSAGEFAEAFDAVGGDANAYTTKEYTAFYARLLAEHAGLGLELLADLLTEPLLAASDLDAERQVILEELAAHDDEPADVCAELLANLLYPDHPLGRDPLGTRESIEGIDAPTLRQFFEARYRSAGMVVALAGQVDVDAACAHLSALPARLGLQAPLRHAPSAPASKVAVLRRRGEQVHLGLAWRSVDRHDPARYAASVYTHLLGGGLSSRLFQEVRERRGLAYAIGADREAWGDAGAMQISVATGPDQVAEVVEVCLATVDAIGRDGPTEREVDIARSNLRAEVLLSHEDSGSRMHRLGAGVLLHGAARPIEETLAGIEAVDLDAVGNFAASITSADAVLAAVGPTTVTACRAALQRRTR